MYTREKIVSPIKLFCYGKERFFLIFYCTCRKLITLSSFDGISI